MVVLRHGVHGEFWWAELYNPAVQLPDFVRACPDLVLGKSLVVTSFDSGPLKLDPFGSEEGWRESGELTILGHVRDLGGLPYAGHDEWYVFTEPPTPGPLEVFINFCGFKFGASSAGDHEGLPDQQRRFWTQYPRLGAESYLGEGDIILFATRNPALFEKAIRVLEQLLSRKE